MNIVIGMVRIIKIGLTIRLRIDKTSATQRAAVKEITSTPCINQAIPITDRAIKINLVIVRMSE